MRTRDSAPQMTPVTVNQVMTATTSTPPSVLRTDFTIEEAAALLRVSASTARRLVASGDLPGYRVGRSVRVPAAAIEALKNRPAHE